MSANFNNQSVNFVSQLEMEESGINAECAPRKKSDSKKAIKNATSLPKISNRVITDYLTESNPRIIKPGKLAFINVGSLYKSIFSSDTGSALNIIKSQKKVLNKLTLNDSSKSIIVQPKTSKQSFNSKENIYLTESSRNQPFYPSNNNKAKEEEVTFNNNCKVEGKRNSSLDVASKGIFSSQYFSTKSPANSESKVVSFCPFCQHCNTVQNNYNILDNTVNKETESFEKGKEPKTEAEIDKEKAKANLLRLNSSAKSILNKAVEFIFNMHKIPDFSYFDSAKIDKNEKEIKSFPKAEYPHRVLYTGIGTFMIAMSEGKVNLEDFLSTENKEKYLNSFLATGLAYGYTKVEDNFKPEQAKEIGKSPSNILKINSFNEGIDKNKHAPQVPQSFFTPQAINKNNERYEGAKKYLSQFEFTFDNEIGSLLDEESRKNIQIILNKTRIKQEIVKEQLREKEFAALSQTRKKALCFFLIFMQILSDLSSECKERAYLIFLFFKLYFAEQESKFSRVIAKLYDKIKFYKDLCKLIVQQKNKHLDKMEEISDVLVSQRVTYENLSNHKRLIQDLLQIINEKREEIYLLKADIEIMTRELNIFLIEFDQLKLDNDCRKKLREVDRKEIVRNIREEMKHKKHTEIQEILLANSDLFLLLSGQRSYFYDQKEFYLQEIDKLKKHLNEVIEDKENYKIKYYKFEEETKKSFDRMSNEIIKLRSMVAVDNRTIGVQTEIDYYGFNLMLKNHENANYSKTVKRNCLMRDYIDNVMFSTAVFAPISLSSLQNLIVDVYEAKLQNDYHNDLKKHQRMYFDEFFELFMKERLKIDSVVKDCSEKAISSIIKYSRSNFQIDLFKRFLCIGELKIRRQALDIYLVILNALPLSLLNLIKEDTNKWYIAIDNIIELFISQLSYLDIIKDIQFDLFSKAEYKKQATSVDSKSFIGIGNSNISEADNKLFTYLVGRFIVKSFMFLNRLKEEKNERLKQKQERNSQVLDAINNLSQETLNSLNPREKDALNRNQMQGEYPSDDLKYTNDSLDDEEDLIVDIKSLKEEFEFANKGLCFDFEAIFRILTLRYGFQSSFLDVNSCRDLINLTALLKDFKSNASQFKIKIHDYLSIVIEVLISKFAIVEKKILAIYEYSDIRKRGMLPFVQLEIIFNLILKQNQDSKGWKLTDFYLHKNTNIDKEFITEEEFINYCFDYKPILAILLSESFKVRSSFNS